MSNLDFSALSKESKQQLAVTLSTLILHDSKTPINADNLNKVLKASHNEVPAHWTNAFSHSLESTPVDKLLTCGGSSAQGSSPAEASAPAKAEKKVEAKKEEPKEEEVEVDFDMGDMFG